MNFLFSTPCSRLQFLARYFFTNLIIALSALLPLIVYRADPDSTPDISLAVAAACVVALPVLYYQIRYAVVARLESMGTSGWSAILLVLPVVIVVFHELQVKELLPGMVALIWQSMSNFFIGVSVLYLLFLVLFPQDGFKSGNALQAFLHDFEVGEGQMVIRLVLLFIAIAALIVVYTLHSFSTPLGQFGGLYHGLNDIQSMDNAQLARQISRGEGFTTKFLRPSAVTQLQKFAANRNAIAGQSGDLFPSDQYPKGTPRIIPDTYNAPGYPYLLAGWFYLVRPDFDEPVKDLQQTHLYSGDRWIPFLNLIFTLLTAGLLFGLGLRLFDERVAWMGSIAFLLTDLVWQYMETGLSTSTLMFLITAMLFCAVEIYTASQNCFESETASFKVVLGWTFLLGLLLAAACLTRLHLLILLAPLLVFFLRLPKTNSLLFPLVALIALGSVAPWFWHMYKLTGNPLGSNTAQLIYGLDNYTGNQIWCTTSIPSYEQMFKSVGQKEILGFRWHLEHAWELLGCNPMVLLFAAGAIHPFRRVKTQIFYWLVAGCAVALIAANNLGVTDPKPVDAWNTVVVLCPVMIVVGCAFFFIMFDRLNIQVWLLSNLIISGVLLLTALPMVFTIINSNVNQFYCFPPYMPPVIKLLGQLTEPDEWVTCDMPWASAWYADRPSLWLPDSVTDFETLNDTVCPTGILYFTPVTWAQPASNLTTGENKDWLRFVTEIKPPSDMNFPLSVSTTTGSGGPEYKIWSDRPRWQAPGQ